MSETGVCPVCNGSKAVRFDSEGRPPGQTAEFPKWPWRANQTLACLNCGGRSQVGMATGSVRLRPDGTPCVHEFQERKVSNCYYRHTCRHCGEHYDIDSSD